VNISGLNMKINKEELYKLYMKEVEAICEVCDWKTSFSAEECVNIVAYLLEENPELITNDN
jgi:hypothetical protein